MATTKKAPAKKAGATKKAGKSGGALVLQDGKTPPNRDALAKACEVYGIEVPDDAPVEALLEAVREHLAKVLPATDEDDKVFCESRCQEISTSHTDFCPFCGDMGLDPADAGKVEPVPPAEKPLEKGKGKKGKPAPEPAAVPAAEAKPDTDAAIDAAGAELDRRLERIRSLQGDLALNSWDLGNEILQIAEQELWKARGHESFKAFVEKDLSIGRSLAYRLMDVVKQWDRETFLRIGPTKLSVIGSIKDEAEREEALAAAEAGASERELKRARRAAPAPSGAGGGSHSSPPPPKKGSEITLLAKVGGKAVNYQFRSASTGRPLAKHKDDAYVEVEISPDVRQRIALKLDAEGAVIGLTVQFVRVEAAAAE